MYLFTICNNHSPLKLGHRFSLKARSASIRSWLVRRISYDARSKSSPSASENEDHPNSKKDLPVSKGRSSDLEIACFAARRANGAMKL